MIPYVESGLHLDTTGQIDEHQELLAEFLLVMFGMSPDETLPMTWRCGCWPSLNFGGAAVAHRGSRAQWSSWVLAALQERFGITALHGIHTPVAMLLDDIAAARRNQQAQPH